MTQLTPLLRNLYLALNGYAKKIEENLDANFICYYGPIQFTADTKFKECLEQSLEADDFKKKDTLAVMLTTDGGSVELVEKMVHTIRHHYETVYFIVPDRAMSAGTIFCMSGDKIYMQYSSTLGPIDPQILNNQNQWVPALGYIDQFEKYLAIANDRPLNDAEIGILLNIDQAFLRQCQQAREISVTLLKEWLVKYKFKDWVEHRTTDPGSPVTREQKEQRAEEIAKQLSDNNKWHVHGRPIHIDTLVGDLRLEINDYSENAILYENITEFYSLLNENHFVRGINFDVYTRYIV